jgi:hypothetical protein
MDAKGYFGLDVDGIGNPPENSVSLANKCTRWAALKLYIQEWARQHPYPNPRDAREHDAWGVTERKGSWAI